MIVQETDAVLITKASKELQNEIDKELEKEDPKKEKAKAVLGQACLKRVNTNDTNNAK